MRGCARRLLAYCLTRSFIRDLLFVQVRKISTSLLACDGFCFSWGGFAERVVSLCNKSNLHCMFAELAVIPFLCFFFMAGFLRAHASLCADHRTRKRLSLKATMWSRRWRQGSVWIQSPNMIEHDLRFHFAFSRQRDCVCNVVATLLSLCGAKEV